MVLPFIPRIYLLYTIFPCPNKPRAACSAENAGFVVSAIPATTPSASPRQSRTMRSTSSQPLQRQRSQRNSGSSSAPAISRPSGRLVWPRAASATRRRPTSGRWPRSTRPTACRQHRPAERYGPHLLALRARRPACALPDVYRRRRDHRSQQARTLAHRRTITQKHPEASPGVFGYYRYATVADKGFLEPWFASGPAPSAA